METIQFLNYSPKQLQGEITASVKAQLEQFLKNYQPQQPKEYLSRKDVAKMFGVDISTISNWQKSKKLRPLGLGSRVYFLRSEVENSLIPLNH
jgi:predicted DNA-binding transcriptional regulator AlpA